MSHQEIPSTETHAPLLDKEGKEAVLLKKKKWPHIRQEIIIGVVTSFLLIPDSMAYAFIGHVEPTTGLHTGWILGIITALFGGRPGMINGITGGFGSMVSKFVATPEDKNFSGDGIVLLFFSVILAGILIIIFAFFKLGTLNNLIPSTVKIGFCNGLALIIARGQTDFFLDPNGEYITGSVMGLTWMYAIGTTVIMELFPKIPNKICKKIPPSLICLIICIAGEFAIVRNCGAFTYTVGDIATISSENAFPKLIFLNDKYNMDELHVDDAVYRIIIQGISIAVLACMETLMTMEVVNDFTKNEGNADRQFYMLGVGNILCGLLGASGGDAMLGVTTVNCVAGGKGRTSSFVAALMCMIILMGAYPILNFIPLGCLIGLMIIVVYHTFKWYTLKSFLSALLPMQIRERLNFHAKMDRLDLTVIVIVTILTVLTNLVVAVLAGMLVASLVFAQKITRKLNITSRYLNSEKKDGKVTKIYNISGPVFFGTKSEFMRNFTILSDPEFVHIHFEEDSFLDYSILEALNVLSKRYLDVGKKLKIKKLKQKQKTVEKAKQLIKNIEFFGEEDLDLPELPNPHTYAGFIEVKEVYQDQEEKKEAEEAGVEMSEIEKNHENERL